MCPENTKTLPISVDERRECIENLLQAIEELISARIEIGKNGFTFQFQEDVENSRATIKESLGILSGTPID